jgi:hypothetical protein
LRNNWALPEESRPPPPSAPCSEVYNIGGIEVRYPPRAPHGVVYGGIGVHSPPRGRDEQHEPPSWRNNFHRTNP